MDVLLCAACGRTLTRPVRLLPGLPESPARDGLPAPDGLRRAPARMPRGTYAADPLPLDAAGLDDRPDRHRHIGGCGPCGEHGADRLCPCGAEVAIMAGDRTTDHEIRFVPESVRVTTAPAAEGTA
ncbi:hypothetical protein ABZ484_13185 [Streptomyces sp. NPDC006393]|uniref:hypothetical protein n=1 Tax=Streptomyces sp. NPDC006393 TaxID=3156763 RepID=UPI0033D179B6